MTKDQVFSEPRQIVDFVFDHTVAEVFPDMIRRSVPGYELVVPMTGLLAARHIRGRQSALVYDLGCSLGATTLAILRALESLSEPSSGLRVHAVDNSPAMLERAKANITDPRVSFVEADIQDLPLETCQVVTLNWVLQFVPLTARPGLLQRICRSLAPDGLVILSEKVRSDDPAIEAFNNAAHLDFKRANGYSELEISQKRSALEQVMIPDTVDVHLARLRAAGFREPRLWFQCLNWASFVATP